MALLCVSFICYRCLSILVLTVAHFLVIGFRETRYIHTDVAREMSVNLAIYRTYPVDDSV